MLDDKTLLRVQNVRFDVVRFQQKKTLLKDINFDIERGQSITIIGPNGAGKSTLLKVILGIEKKTSGDIIKRKGIKIGYMPQSLNLDPIFPLSVRDFVSLVLTKKNVTDADIDHALNLTGTLHLKSQPFHTLSGGERQKVMLSRLILLKPDLLVLDEPDQGVDIKGRIHFYNLLNDLKKQFGWSLLMVSHDLNFVMKNTDYVLCLNTHICCHGKPQDMVKNPTYYKTFGLDEKTYKDLSLYVHHHDHDH